MPGPSPEGELIRRAREAYIPRMSLKAAAAKVGISVEYWGYVERGYQPGGRGQPPKKVVPSKQALAQMAYAVEIKPEELDDVGREDAAELLREIARRQRAREEVDAGKSRNDQAIVRQMAEFFEDESIPPEEKRIMAERFFRVLPYYLTGQRPPRELLTEDESPENGSPKTA